MKVLKFGGSSVGSPENILRVKSIVESQQESCIVVVSAFGGVTDQLIILATTAMQRTTTMDPALKVMEQRHLDVAKTLLSPEKQEEAYRFINQMFSEISDILKGVYLLREISPKTQDLLLSYGELLSSYIFSFVIKNGRFYDSRKFIRTNSSFGAAKVDFDLTHALIDEQFKVLDHIPVIPGFIAFTEQEETTTLGRGGSDYTAAIVAAALNASALEIWTDVDGFMTADPEKVHKAFAIEKLTYAEAMELSHFGAKVVYTPTIHPVYKKGIPIIIKNTFNPIAPGTVISNEISVHEASPIKGISSIDNVSLITIQGAGMVGVTGISMRVFRALAKYRINAILITQASSEFSISIAVVPADAEKAKNAIEEEFQTEVYLRDEIKVSVEADLSIIAIVGEHMRNTPGISANLFASLAHNGISVIATAQGSSELNISVVIRKISLNKALNAIHEGFFLSHYKELNLFFIGIGNVGGSLLRQIHRQQKKLMEELRLKMNVVGLTNSKKMFISAEGIDISNYKDVLLKEGITLNLEDYIAKIGSLNLRNSVLVDCTANEQVASYYSKAMDYYLSVVTANKIACSGSYDQYKHLKDKAKKKGVKFKFETNVGAGLPVINTINDLVHSGDKILKIEAVLSGTLNFIFNNISKEIPLSQTIRLAKEKGYSEPDPRIDLSGTDVVRKILILAREAGYQLEKEQVKVNTFLPPDCFEGSLDEFWLKVENFDASFEACRQEVEEQEKRWRFVATFENCSAVVQLIEVDFNHPAYVLEGSNNIIILTTERYRELPMVIKGYGAGAEVTAAGMFADIIRVADV
ncbi:MAG TPA: bifunctional aspartate kinase/homoserine dehydrogenase I [Bacteroidales bacterium]